MSRAQALIKINLPAHDHAHKLLVVDVALRVLLVGEQLLHLVVGQLLAERRQQVPQLGGRDEAAGVLVEVAQALDKVVGRVHAARLRDGLVVVIPMSRQKYLLIDYEKKIIRLIE